MIFSFSPQIQEANASGKSPYDSGYDHGCDDAEISNPSNRYINQPERGPSFHTDQFMDGYRAGFDDCSNTNRDSDSPPVQAAEGLRVLVHMAGKGIACVSSDRQDLGCSTADDSGTLEFVFDSGAVEVGDDFTVCFKDSEDEPFYACQTGVNGPEKSPEHVYS